MMVLLPVRIIPGGLHQDARGEVQHVNAFNFENVDRFYSVTPTNPGEVRGWVGHRRGWKWLFAVKGIFDVGIVQPATWGTSSRNEKVQYLQWDAVAPCILEVPQGSYAASTTNNVDSTLLIFSARRIETAVDDDFRLPPDYWTIL